MSHRKRRNERGLVHLEHYTGLNGNLDAAKFVLQDFIVDIRSGIEALFRKARNNTALRQHIKSNLNTRPPLGIV